MSMERMKRFHATRDLDAMARAALDRAWEDGRAKYPGDPWRFKTPTEHFEHLVVHVDGLLTAGPDIAWPLEDIDHAIFRLCALRWVITQPLEAKTANEEMMP